VSGYTHLLSKYSKIKIQNNNLHLFLWVWSLVCLSL
jgi:hypothetical protein